MFKRIAILKNLQKTCQMFNKKTVSYNDVVEETNKIIKDNKEAIERKAIQLANNKISKFSNDLGLLSFDEEFIKELVKTQQTYQKDCICRQIEHKVIIERLYPDGEREGCLSKLPEWIYEIVN